MNGLIFNIEFQNNQQNYTVNDVAYNRDNLLGMYVIGPTNVNICEEFVTKLAI
jgi:hypothetical protein